MGVRGTVTPQMWGALTEPRKSKWGQKEASLPSAATLLDKHFCLLLFTPQLTESEAFELGLLVYPIKRFSRNELGKGAFSACGSVYAVVYHCMYVFTQTA